MIARRMIPLLALGLVSLGAPLSAQIEGGVQGSMNSGIVSGEATLGIGGRFGGYLFRTGDVHWKADAVVDYFFANCPLDDVRCWAWHAHANLVGTRKLGQPVLGYAGLGAAYQRERLVSSSGGDVDATGDHGGVSIVVGAQFPVVRAARPFFEARYSVFEGWENQLVLSIGVLFSSAKIEDDF